MSMLSHCFVDRDCGSNELCFVNTSWFINLEEQVALNMNTSIYENGNQLLGCACNTFYGWVGTNCTEFSSETRFFLAWAMLLTMDALLCMIIILISCCIFYSSSRSNLPRPAMVHCPPKCTSQCCSTCCMLLGAIGMFLWNLSVVASTLHVDPDIRFLAEEYYFDRSPYKGRDDVYGYIGGFIGLIGVMGGGAIICLHWLEISSNLRRFNFVRGTEMIVRVIRRSFYLFVFIGIFSWTVTSALSRRDGAYEPTIQGLILPFFGLIFMFFFCFAAFTFTKIIADISLKTKAIAKMYIANKYSDDDEVAGFEIITTKPEPLEIVRQPHHNYLKIKRPLLRSSIVAAVDHNQLGVVEQNNKIMVENNAGNNFGNRSRESPIGITETDTRDDSSSPNSGIKMNHANQIEVTTHHLGLDYDIELFVASPEPKEPFPEFDDYGKGIDSAIKEQMIKSKPKTSKLKQPTSIDQVAKMSRPLAPPPASPKFPFSGITDPGNVPMPSKPPFSLSRLRQSFIRDKDDLEFLQARPPPEPAVPQRNRSQHAFNAPNHSKESNSKEGMDTEASETQGATGTGGSEHGVIDGSGPVQRIGRVVSRLTSLATQRLRSISLNKIAQQPFTVLRTPPELEPGFKRIIHAVRDTAVTVSIGILGYCISLLVYSSIDTKYARTFGGNGWRESANPDNPFPVVKFAYYLQATFSTLVLTAFSLYILTVSRNPSKVKL